MFLQELEQPYRGSQETHYIDRNFTVGHKKHVKISRIVKLYHY